MKITIEVDVTPYNAPAVVTLLSLICPQEEYASIDDEAVGQALLYLLSVLYADKWMAGIVDEFSGSKEQTEQSMVDLLETYIKSAKK